MSVYYTAWRYCSPKQYLNLLLGSVLMIYVGIDVTKDKHDCFIINSDGEVLFPVFIIQNNRNGFLLFPYGKASPLYFLKKKKGSRDF